MEALHCICMQAVLVRWCGHQCRRRAAIEASGAPHILTSFRSSQRLWWYALRQAVSAPAARIASCPGECVPSRHAGGDLGRHWITGALSLAIHATASPSMGSESSIYDTKAERHRAHAKSAYRPSGNQQKHSCRIILHQPGKGGDLRTCFAHVH